jgi:enoyl-CoA hydratase
MEYFKYKIEHKIAHLLLDRPEKLNTMGPKFFKELNDTLQELHASNNARVLVISSTGKHFSAGMSLDAFGTSVAMHDESPEGRAAITDHLAQLQEIFTRIENLRIPTIMAIHGGCIGGAVDMVSAGCLRFASADTFFCVQEINIGMVADLGTLQRLPKLIPMGIVKELAYTGRRLSVERALQYGLVNEILPDQASTLAAAMRAAEEIASKPPVAIWGTKQALHYARDHSTADALEQMGWLQSGIWSNAHVREAILAFQAKRIAEFPDLVDLSKL